MSRKHRRVFRVATLLSVLGAFGAVPALAQSQAVNGTIEGTIKDSSGGMLPGVTVTIQNLDTGESRVIVTDAKGLFRAPLLPLGSYKVAAELSGFKKYEQTGIPINAGASAVVNIVMEVGAMQEVVSVTADAAVVDLGKVDVGRNLGEREIHNLPLVSRNPYNYALLQPGVSGFENSEFGVPRFSANGSLLRINYQMDGNTNTQKDRAGLRLLPMSEVMISEVKVTTSGYAPEFGQTMGLVYNAITPSGTNRLKGDAAWRYRKTAFSAFPFFFTQPKTDANKPLDNVNTTTAGVGGPILRDKLFFFGGFERTYRDMPRLITITPADAAAVGLPSQPGSVPASQNVKFVLAKIDYRISDAHRLSTRFNWFQNGNPYNGGAGGTTAMERSFDFFDKMNSTSAQLISTWGPNLLNELRTQYAQRHQVRNSHDGSAPGLAVNITGSVGFGAATTGDETFEGISQVIDNFTIMRGSHSFKQGFDYQYVKDWVLTPLTQTYTFPTIADYLAAKSGAAPFGYSTFAQVIGDPRFDMSTNLFSAFWQDDWRLADNFKMLYGVRYDAYLYPKADPESPFEYSRNFKSQANNWGPRFGIAWTLGRNKDQVIRASTGVMYDQPLLAIYQNSIQQNGVPARTTVSVNGTQGGTRPAGANAVAFPNTYSDLPPGFTLPPQTITAPDPDLKLAYNIQNSAQYERGFGRSYHGSVAVVYNRGYNLPVITNINPINPIGTLADGRGLYSTASNTNTRLDPRFNVINVVQSPGTSTYHALMLTFGKRSSSGVQYDINYTYGKGVDNAPITGTLAVQGDQNRSDPRDLNRDKGPNALDTRHSLNGSIVARSQFHYGPALLQKILSDNQASIILQFNSGIPFTITSNRDLNGDGSGSDRPLFIGRNSVYLPARHNVDARLSRFIPLGGGRRVEISGEFKNIFNTVQVSSVRSQVQVDAAGNPILPIVFANAPVTTFTSIPTSGSDFVPSGGYEQRKFSLGFKFSF
ncbi:MAG TPA: TonB-dependent receptor [Vicinamibacterales bacterium]|jgi:hypothetical protein|nr:TonB-dependent receptor [Vicinamibacterales bacterium]